MDEIFIDLAIILFVAFVISSVARLFNQPIIIGYILAGMIISPFVIAFGASKEIIDIFSELGIAFLLFIVGLHLNPKVVKELGVTSLLIGGGQILLTFTAGFLISFGLLGFDFVSSLYISIAVALSSTIIVMKILSDKRQLDSLYGKIATGVLIIQDLVAIGVLMFISSMSNGNNFSSFAIKGLLGGGALIAVLFLFGYFFLPRIMKGIAKSQELLFLFSISWCFVIASLFVYTGFSIEIGALVAGVILSISPYSIEITSKIRPLRDFFLIIFFIILGLNVQVSNLSSIIIDGVILAGIALFLKPFILTMLTAMFGYTKRTNFLVGSTLGQISEFSLIILALGVSMGHISKEVQSIMTLAGIITIAVSTYILIYNSEIYKKMSKIIFEKKNIKEKVRIKKQYDAILFGHNRIGFGILNALKRTKKSYLVVDFNPDTIADLTKLKVPALYGDIDDVELLEELPLNKLKLAVSTIPDFEINSLLINTIKKVNPDAVLIVRAHKIEEALELYKKGASYVLTPHFLGGEYVSKMIREIKVNQDAYKEEREKHKKMLQKMFRKGHKHPEVERN
jgi:Kef-type K+ transport system membrane component KefB/Trk K+ transport system NAD-binding subunit